MWTLRCFIQLGGTDVDLGKPWGAAEVTFGDMDAYQRRRVVDELEGYKMAHFHISTAAD
jgi:hypothetical protein